MTNKNFTLYDSIRYHKLYDKEILKKANITSTLSMIYRRKTHMINSIKSGINCINIILGNNTGNISYFNEKIGSIRNRADKEPQFIDYPRNQINKNIYNFIYFNAYQRDNNGYNLSILFNGGDPLYYYTELKEIVNNTYMFPSTDYRIVTSGNLLDEEKVKFLNDYSFKVIIPWNGSNTNKIYKHSDTGNEFDILKEKKSLLMQLDKLTIAFFICKYTSLNTIVKELEQLNQEYIKIHNYTIDFYMDEIIESNSSYSNLIDLNNIKLWTKDYLYKISTKLPINTVSCMLIDKYIQEMRRIENNDKVKNTHLTIDRKGNIYAERFCLNKLGEIDGNETMTEIIINYAKVLLKSNLVTNYDTRIMNTIIETINENR